MHKCSRGKVVLLAILVFCLLGTGTVGRLRLRADDDLPSISDMLVQVARTEAQQEVLDAVLAAEDLLDADDLYGAKLKIMRLKATVELTSADYRVLDPVERKVDEALADDLEDIVARIERELEEEELLSDYRRQKLLEDELKRRSAAALVEEARMELYQLNRPREALGLAREAFALDPQNEDAERLIIEAEVELKERAAVLTAEAETLTRQARMRVEALRQEYLALERRALDLEGRERYEEALGVWNNALIHVNVLSVYTDVQRKMELVESRIEALEQRLARHEEERAEDLARRREAEATEARERLERELRAREQLGAEREAERLNMAWSYVRRGRYSEARKIVNGMLAEDSTNEGALFLAEQITRREHDDIMRRVVQSREREDLALFRKVYERATAPADEITFPEKELWDRIVGRPEVPYPLGDLEVPMDEIDIRRQLDEYVVLVYPEEGRQTIVDVIDTIHRYDHIDVQIIVNRNAFEDRQPPTVTADFRARLRTALDHLVREGSRGEDYPLAWQIEGETILIDHPDAFREENILLVYDIRDLLLSISDAGADHTPARPRPGTPRNGDVSDADRTRIEREIENLERELEDNGWLSDTEIRRIEQEIRDLEAELGVTTRTRTDRGARDLGPGMLARAESLKVQLVDIFWALTGVDIEENIFFREENPGDFIVIQPRRVHEELERLLKSLREATHIQVHVETRFVEVTESFLKELGVNWQTLDLTPDFRPGDSGAQLSADIGTGVPVFPERTSVPSLKGLRFDFGIFEGIEMEAFLKAVQMSEHTRVTQIPSLTLMNTQRGQLWIRTEQPYISDYNIRDIADQAIADPVMSVAMDSIRLDLRPIVSSCRRYVYLELNPDIETVLEFRESTITVPVSEFVPSEVEGQAGRWVTVPLEVPISQPIELIQEFQSTVGVPDRGLLVVGGLGRTTERDIETGIPVLSKIPILKRVFGSHGKRREDQTLLILVRPRIIMLQEEEDYAF